MPTEDCPEERGEKRAVLMNPWCWAGALLVLLVYSLPLAIFYARHGQLMAAADFDDSHYGVRVVHAARGGSLGNPFLAEQEGAARYLPEMVERSLAWVARVSGVDALIVLAASRVVFPVLIFLLLYSLARSMEMEPHVAALAAALPPLLPSLATFFTPRHPHPGWLRYFRLVSPAPHVLVLLLALRALKATCDSSSLRRGVLAGLAIGLLFFTPFYYWTFTLGGATWLVLTGRQELRRALLLAILVALLTGIPYAVRTSQVLSLPEVQETLARVGYMVSGRQPEEGALPRFFLALAFAVLLFSQRRRPQPSARFLQPFVFLGPPLFLQNVVTNRVVESYHWISCLIPVWSLAGVSLCRQWPVLTRPNSVLRMGEILLAGAILVQINASARWEVFRAERPRLYGMETSMKQTLQWLNRRTASGSVVLAEEDVMVLLPMFTHNKVYWSQYAGLHVVSEWEYLTRRSVARHWNPLRPGGIPFRADFYVGTGPVCGSLPPARLLYRNRTEGTCVMALAPSKSAARPRLAASANPSPEGPKRSYTESIAHWQRARVAAIPWEE